METKIPIIKRSKDTIAKPKATIVFLVNGNNFILSTTKSNLAKLYNPIAINVANAAPFIPYFGIKIKFNPTTIN